MRAAIRGDFERLEQRRGAQELMHVRESAHDVTSGAGPQPEPEPSQVLATEPVVEAQELHVELAEQGAPAEPSGTEVPVEPPELEEVAEPAPRSWLARLLAAIPPRQV